MPFNLTHNVRTGIHIFYEETSVGKKMPDTFLGILGRGVPPGSPNPDPISDQKMPFLTPVFRPPP